MKAQSNYPKKLKITYRKNVTAVPSELYPAYNAGYDYDLSTRVKTVHSEDEENQLFDSVDYENLESIIEL